MLRAYLLEELLPLWWEHGIDRDSGGFWNGLQSTLEPIEADHKRLRVQARQVYAFSVGARLGAESFAREAADTGFAYLCERYWQPAGGWHRTLTLDGKPLDPTLDTYDCAFVLLALGAYHDTTGEPEALRAIDRTLDVMEARLLDPGGLGFLSQSGGGGGGAGGERLQNPQMHLVEAFLALYESTSASRWLARAQGLVELFRWKLFEPEPGCVGEVFDADWSRRSGPLEPGHQLEWSWLLERYARATGEPQWLDLADRLFAFGTRHGVDPEFGGVYDRVDRTGRVVADSKRLWPQLEQVQALAARAEREKAGHGAGAHRALERSLGSLFARWRQPGHAGWFERLSREGDVLQAEMPATSLYHLVAAFADAISLDAEPAG